jgi:hypothetical protein
MTLLTPPYAHVVAPCKSEEIKLEKIESEGIATASDAANSKKTTPSHGSRAHGDRDQPKSERRFPILFPALT